MNLDLCDYLDDYPDFKGVYRSGMHKTHEYIYPGPDFISPG